MKRHPLPTSASPPYARLQSYDGIGRWLIIFQRDSDAACNRMAWSKGCHGSMCPGTPVLPREPAFWGGMTEIWRRRIERNPRTWGSCLGKPKNEERKPLRTSSPFSLQEPEEGSNLPPDTKHTLSRVVRVVTQPAPRTSLSATVCIYTNFFSGRYTYDDFHQLARRIVQFGYYVPYGCHNCFTWRL